MLNKHKLFLLCAKWIPVVTAIGILFIIIILHISRNNTTVNIIYSQQKKIFSLMEKTNCLLDAVKNQLQNAISNIDAGNSNLNEEEMEELVKTLSVLNKGVKRISKAYACEHILHCSPATFDNYIRAGIIPKGKKEIGFNELSWSLKDFDGVKLQRIHKK